MMENETYNQKFRVQSLANYIGVESTKDYERLIEYCERTIKSNKIMIIVMKQNYPANMTADEVRIELALLTGENRALIRMRDLLQERLF